MNVLDRLQGERAIVTGAGAGIGRAIALRLVEEGAMVTLADVDEDAAPGTGDTPWLSCITATYDPEEARAAMQARQPHNRFVTPKKIAAMATYLASEESGSTWDAVPGYPQHVGFPNVFS